MNMRSAAAEMSNRLVTIETAKKWGLLCPFRERELGSYLAQCGLGRGLPPYQVTS